jgi:hypothetical protein
VALLQAGASVAIGSSAVRLEWCTARPASRHGSRAAAGDESNSLRIRTRLGHRPNGVRRSHHGGRQGGLTDG